jgi:hypothetical protein
LPFTNNPANSTYKTVPIKFDQVTYFRSGNLAVQKDSQMVNCFYDRVSSENQERQVSVKKRAGIGATTYSLSKVSSTDVLRGSFYDPDQNAFYWVVGNKLYNLKPDVSATPNLVQTINTSSGYCGFCSYLKSDNTRYVVMSDGTDCWLHNYVAATCVRITDVDFPTPHQPNPIYIDGYLIVIKANSGDIYTSNVDDPFSWTAGDFISAEIASDYAIRLVKAKNYIVCMGYNSIEYFYDAGNASGSPLSRQDSAFRGVGLVSNLTTIGDTTFFVGQDSQQNLSVYQLNSYKVDRISNEVVDRTLQTITSTQNEKSPVILNRDGYSMSIDGHNFYVLVTQQTTWIYDIDEKFWYEIKGSTGAGLAIEAAWQMNDGSLYLGIAGQSFVSIMSTALYQDFGLNYTMRYVTQNFDADTFRWKTCSRVMLFADQQGTGTSNVTVSWSDDDWTTIASTRNLNVFTENCYFKNAGRFRSRSFRFEYTDNYPLRMYRAELDLNVGSH